MTDQKNIFPTFRDIPGYEGCYQISDAGQIIRTGKSTGATVGRRLKLQDHKEGYIATSLWMDNKEKRFLVHRLVYAAFCGPILDGLQINHINGNKKDNRLENLEAVTQQENIEHAVRTGLADGKGEKNSQAKLTAEKVRDIRASHIPGLVGYKKLAKKHGVKWETIRGVLKKETWQHVK